MSPSGSQANMSEFEPEVFDRAIVAVVLTAGPDHRLVYYNDAFTRLFGPRRLGAPAAEVFHEPRAARFIRMLEGVFRDHTARQATSPRTTEGTHPGAPGRRHFVYSCSPVVSRYGSGVLAIAVDTTPQVEAARRAEEQSQERHRALQRYEALMSAVPQIIWLMKPNGEITELVGGFEEFTGTAWRPVIDAEWLAAVHPHDRGRLVRTWKEAAEDPPTFFVCTSRMRTVSGEYRHVQSRAVPVVRDGVTEEWIGSSTDVEDQWHNRLRERLLARVATVTAAHDVPQALAAVAAAVVPELTDTCAVFMLPSPELTGTTAPDGTLTVRRVASNARPGLPPLPPLSGEMRPVGPLARRVIDSGRPELLVFPGGEPPAGAVPDVSTQWLREARATSLALVPILIDSTVVAFACAAGCQDSPPPGPADVELLVEVLHEVREPLRQAMELQRTRRTALTLQRALLTHPPEVPGAEMAAHYQPASRTAEVGGDWYDALLLPDGSVTLTIGDIAGHDLEAATSMSQLRSMLRVIAFDRSRPADPAESLAQLDRVADGLSIAPLVTAVHARLVPAPDGGWHAAWSNAGHPPPLLLPAAGPPRYLEGHGPDLPLCVAPAERRHTWHQELGIGDTLLLYTDGLIEIPGTDLADGMADLAVQARAARDCGVSLATLCAQLLAAVSERRDDAAVIGFRPVAAGRPAV
ncbi:SpoIIE family protein phosphatase [Actinacidiphila sp. ITFR-21]|uniref:SpoIIE family protein phosphatase n=1 Tax=Actinacidiphila sp. ITFR-21 TaxID=3075199 RepID=UPI0028894C63|nr:SpoIIE family protein phosphatase [Streptomyces sp. ITFR-21]WNI14494.1 SpoIIE family protein phosphatase [Streptomyces sp. ITFR-21]